jgi:ubiquinone/menaquinone biosynthesis C-methylase UbiE
MRMRFLPFLLALGLSACASPPEESVKPGINDSFLNPELDVDSYVARFEVESREIYVERKGLTAAVGLQAGMAVADIGAGTGLFEPLFAAAVGETGMVYAVDISSGMIEHLNERKQKEGWENVEIVQCGEDDARLPSGSVDRVFICDTYHHFEYPRATMRSIRTALRKGGELIIVDFERIPGVTREWLLEHVRAGKAEVIAELQGFGFELIEEIKIPGLHENYVLRLRRR